jgi:hypothetical protein
MSIYEDREFRLELDRKGKLYYRDMLLFFGDTHLAISMFIRNSLDADLNVKLKKRINKGV